MDRPRTPNNDMAVLQLCFCVPGDVSGDEAVGIGVIEMGHRLILAEAKKPSTLSIADLDAPVILSSRSPLPFRAHSESGMEQRRVLRNQSSRQPHPAPASRPSQGKDLKRRNRLIDRMDSSCFDLEGY